MDQLTGKDIPHSQHRRRRSAHLLGIRMARRNQGIYTGLTVLLSLFINYVFLWPVNHFWALALFAVAVSSVLLSELQPRLALGLSASFFVLAFVLYGLIGPVPTAESLNRRWLSPGAAPTPPNPCTDALKGQLPPDTTLALVGTDAILLHPGRNTPILTVGQCKSVALDAVSGGLILNVDDFDADGQLNFRITNNQLHLIDGRPAYQERAGDRTGATIFSEDGDEQFGIDFLNPHTARLRGTFACKGHAPVRITDTEPIPGATAPRACLNGRGIDVP